MPIPEIPGFLILERIGKGGMAEVYLARQLALGRLVAIKFLSPDGPGVPDVDVARFRREAELMAKVPHPNILTIFDFGEADGYYYLIVEFAEGGDLRRRMDPGSPMPLDQIGPIVRTVGEALAHLHRQGIVHRDLKPENILLNEEGKPIVSDFGISTLRAADGPLTRTGRGPGTMGYIAPEQQYGLKVDERADQYSFAALTYEMLTGHLPLGIFKRPSEQNPRVGPEVDAVILRALREEPRDRFATIGEFADELDRALAGPPAKPAWPAPRLRRGWALLAAIAILGGIVARSVLFSRIQAPPKVPALKVAPFAGPVKPPAPLEDPRVHRMKEIRANEIWVERGSPGGTEGEAAAASIWFKAAEGIDREIKEAAYQFWVESGSPTGEAGRRASPVNWEKAVRRLYKEMTGEDAPPP